MNLSAGCLHLGLRSSRGTFYENVTMHLVWWSQPSMGVVLFRASRHQSAHLKSLKGYWCMPRDAWHHDYTQLSFPSHLFNAVINGRVDWIIRLRKQNFNNKNNYSIFLNFWRQTMLKTSSESSLSSDDAGLVITDVRSLRNTNDQRQSSGHSYQRKQDQASNRQQVNSVNAMAS